MTKRNKFWNYYCIY